MKSAYRQARARLAKLRTCQYGATAAEYAIGAAMVVAAWGSADMPHDFSGSFAASATESCSPAPRGTTARWERPVPRCTARHDG